MKDVLYIAVLVVLLGVVSAFHLQSQPGVVNRVCTQRNRMICQRNGMRCRANQAFDADMPHAVCDRINGRGRGIRPELLVGGRRTQTRGRFGTQFGSDSQFTDGFGFGGSGGFTSQGQWGRRGLW